MDLSRTDQVVALLENFAHIGENCAYEGWDSYGGSPVSLEHLEKVQSVTVGLMNLGMPIPMVSPTSDGGIFLTWGPIGTNEAELEITFDPGICPVILVSDHANNNPNHNMAIFGEDLE